MAEFKFFCPQCGQHIQCDTSYAGTQINCPVCQQAITVPQVPRAASAAQPPVAAKSRALRNILLAITTVLVLAGLGVGGWYGYSKIKIHYLHGHLPAGLVALWSGDDNANDSVGGNNGQFLNHADFAEGKVGKAFALHGLGDGVTVSTVDLPDGISDRTIDCWIYIKSFVPNAETFVAGYGNFGVAGQCYILGLDVNHHLFFSQWGAAITGPTLSPGHWYNIAVTSVSTNSIALYLNGMSVATGSLSFNTPGGSKLYIGEVEAPYAKRQLIGLIDELAVYNRAVSASEIREIYTKQK